MLSESGPRTAPFDRVCTTLLTNAFVAGKIIHRLFRLQDCMHDRSKSPVFIIGCARSGTTWLYHLLLSSGGFAIYRSESQLYNRFGPSFGNFKNRKQRQEFLEWWLSSEFFLRSGLDADLLRQVVENGVTCTGDLLSTLMNRICDEQRAARWAECTPDNALYIRQIKRDFPDALFIHLVRDGRDVALSLAKQSFVKPFPWHSDRPELASAAYWAWITNIISMEEKFLGDELLTVHYESLVVDHEKTLQRIAEFIGKPISLERIEKQSIGAIINPNSSFDRANLKTDTEWVPRWQKTLDKASIPGIESTIGAGLEKFGYKLSCGRERGFERLTSSCRRNVYFLRFRAPTVIRQSGFMGHLIPRNLENESLDNDSVDPTLRPRENIAAIRNIVRL